MKYAVVYDLELVKRFKKGQPSEIVEIGACKVDLSTLEVVGDFQVYIVPGSGYFSKSTRSFINMTKEDAAGAVPFPVGIRRFADWVGSEAYLISWGRDDKLHIVNECVRKNVPLGWFRNYNDIQREVGRLLTDQKGQLGLKNALALAGIEPVGKAHRGVDDARNTAELLIRFADKLTLAENELTEKDLFPEPKEPRKRQRPDWRSRGKRSDGAAPEEAGTGDAGPEAAKQRSEGAGKPESGDKPENDGKAESGVQPQSGAQSENSEKPERLVRSGDGIAASDGRRQTPSGASEAAPASSSARTESSATSS